MDGCVRNKKHRERDLSARLKVKSMEQSFMADQFADDRV